ncbi:MAG TPA: 4-alpha-glucanotransferase [Chloroflexia bacterium]|nr:4-alpha-glucanotransferase [Chloroflexia bacterium]
MTEPTARSEARPAVVKKEGPRGSGILLHPTSLPGPYGIGDLGPAAYAWVDTLVRAGQKWWQVLPLGPTGYGDSPYQCFSAFAGNPYLVSPDALVQDGLITGADIGTPSFPEDRVDFGPVIKFKVALLTRAWERFRHGAAAQLKGPFEAFCAEAAEWLDDYGLFMALKDAHGGGSWLEWPLPLKRRDEATLAKAKTDLADSIQQHKFRQFLFFRAWRALKAHANAQGVRLIGDIPIFVSSDSSDVWAHPEIFLLDEQRQPVAVAGVPPDYFSKTGQLWGNPLYNWERLKETGYAWWAARFRATLAQVDVVRLDHFRGFVAYWRIPAGMPTAEIGEWETGPGAEFLTGVRKALGGLPIIAEDLGIITPEVDGLREKFGLPGMRILQFAFGGATEDRFLPHTYEHNCVVYTGTHDNDTTRGWYQSATEAERDFCRRYLARDGSDVTWDLIRLAWSSVANLAVAPMQDVLDLGTEARMNLPGRPGGNWSWRFRASAVTPQLVGRLAELTALYAR